VTDGLPIDFQVLVIAETPADLADAVRRLERASSNVSFFGWKEFADGSLGGRTAALYEPYSDDPGNTGTVRLEPDKAQIMAKTALDLGGVVAIHAIGDLANDLVIDVFEQFINDGADPTLLRIEHASMLTDTAVDRMAQLGVTASVQPAFLTSEIDWLGKRLGPRTERAYALARMHEAGIHLLGGSDCPVESPNPWWGMSSAAGQGRLAPREAFGLFAENLRVGAPADFLIVPFDPLNATPDQLRQMTVEHVYKNGNEIPILPELPFT
jgi:predicted amidohydrolase YtcJ